MLEQHREANICLLWLLALAGLHCQDLQVTNLDCFNDYETEMFCFWEIWNSTGYSCSDSLLKYSNNIEADEVSQCVPESIPPDGSNVPTKCVCQVDVAYFVAGLVYNIEVKLNGKSVQNATIRLAEKVKPKTPTNVTLDLNEIDSVILNWDTGYSQESLLHNNLIFNIQLTSKQYPNKIKNTILEQVEPQHKISKRQLKQGYDYMVKVQSRPGFNGYNGTWSEWSHAVEWHNDYSISAHQQLAVIVIGISIGVVFTFLFCFSCVTRRSKEWRSRIPDPAKSQLTSSILLKLPISNMNSNNESQMNNHSLKSNCGTCFKNMFFKTHEDKIRSSTDILAETQDLEAYILIPEYATVERKVEISPQDGKGLTSTSDVTESEGEIDGGNKSLEFDLLINNMIFDILGETSFLFDPPVSMSEKHGDSLSFLTKRYPNDCFYKEGSDVANLKISQEPGSSTAFHNSPVFFSKILQQDHYCSDARNKSSSNIVDGHCYQNSSDDACRIDTRTNEGYSSFASILPGSETKKYSTNSEVDTMVTIDNGSPEMCLSDIHTYHRLSHLRAPDFDPNNMVYDLEQLSILKPYITWNGHATRYSTDNTYHMPMQTFSKYHWCSDPIQQQKPLVSFHSEPTDYHILLDGYLFGPVDNTVFHSGYKSFDYLFNQNRHVENSSSLDIGPHLDESSQSDASSAGANSNMNIKGDETQEHFEHTDPNKLSFACETVHFTDCERIAIQNKLIQYVSDINDCGTTRLTQNKTKLPIWDSNYENVPYAPTLDIDNHLWNASYRNGQNILPGKLDPKPLIYVNKNEESLPPFPVSSIFACHI